MKERIHVLDTTLRDGEQAPGMSMSVDEKLRVAHVLDRAGVSVIEAGFPVSSPLQYEACVRVAESVSNATVCALARAKEGDITVAQKALRFAKRSRVNIFLPVSNLHIQTKLRISKEALITRAYEMATYANKAFDEVEFALEDATRADASFVCDVARAVAKGGASVVNIADTVGYALPHEMAQLIGATQTALSDTADTTISVHCHNDLGLALANTLAALTAGARHVEGTITGAGERAGLLSIIGLLDVLARRGDAFPYVCDVDLHALRTFARENADSPVTVQTVLGDTSTYHASICSAKGVVKTSACDPLYAYEHALRRSAARTRNDAR